MTGDAEDPVARAARVRQAVARTIEQVRAHTADIGHHEEEDVAPDTVADGAVPAAGEKKGGVGGEVGALLARTRAVIARTKSVIEHTRAAIEHDHDHHDHAQASTAKAVDTND